MTRALLNLSTRPFVNRRPVVRLSIVLWAAGLVLLAGNLWLYWDFLAGRGDLDARRREVGEQVAVEEHRIEALSNELASFDLGAQNDQVRYLNDRIEQRRFSWSRLFDELSDVLPRDVRLLRLTPSAGEDPARSGRRTRSFGARRAGALEEGQVPLQIEAQSRNDQAIFELVDALFADAEFDDPNLLKQAQDSSGLIRFNIETNYRPGDLVEPEVTPLEPDVPDADAGGAPSSGSDPAEASSGGGSPVAPVALGRAASASRELS